MKNSSSVYLVFFLALTSGLATAYAVFAGYFNGHQQYELRLSALENQVQREQFEKTLLTYQLKDFQQAVAEALPAKKELLARYEQKNLADVVRSPASASALDLSSALFERGKKSFKDHDYDKAIREFNRLLHDYPLSKHGIESRFFIAESFFLKKDFKSSLGIIDEMVTQYPDNELTGFILLRMGQISEANNQIEEASEIYATVIKNFKSEDLKIQARKLAQNIEFK